MRSLKVDRTFGKRVKRIRNEQDLTQEELAEKIGISLTHMGRVERGVTTPPLTLVEKIAKALKIKIKDLF